MSYTEPEESPMHEDEETEPMEEQEEEQEQPMEEGDDNPHLNLEGDRETQAYNLIKNHEFVHTPTYNPDLLQRLGVVAPIPFSWCFAFIKAESSGVSPHPHTTLHFHSLSLSLLHHLQKYFSTKLENKETLQKNPTVKTTKPSSWVVQFIFANVIPFLSLLCHFCHG